MLCKRKGARDIKKRLSARRRGAVLLEYTLLLCSILPLVSTLSEGTRTIILTVVIASAAALAFPVKDDPVTTAEKEETGHEQ